MYLLGATLLPGLFYLKEQDYSLFVSKCVPAGGFTTSPIGMLILLVL